MASKVCGGRTGVAKQATVISAQHVESFESIIAGLKMILTDIESRQANGQALPGRTVLSMSFAVPLARIRNPTLSQKKSANYMRAILQAIMNKGVVCVCAAGNSAQEEGFAPTRYPSILATDAFPLISVGAVDITGTLAFFSQQGVVYTVGVDSPCAAFREYLHETQADGTSGGEPSEAKCWIVKL